MRGAILDALDGGGVMTTRELLREVPGRACDDQAMLGRVAYHCAVLDRAGLIERVDGTWRVRRG